MHLGATVAAPCAQVCADDFRNSFAAGSRDPAGRFAGGTEMRLPTAPAGRLYAGEYRELGIKLRELARTYVFPGSKRSLLRLSRERSIAGLPTSIPKPREEAARDRQNARLDAVAASRPCDICDVNPGDQTLTVWRAGGSTPTPVGAM